MTTPATLTITLVKSFEYRTIKNIVLKDIDVDTCTVADLIAKAKEEIATRQLKPYLTVDYDCVKIAMKTHGAKADNLVINLQDDDTLILANHGKTLAEYGIKHEYELALFNKATYLAYKANPTTRW